MENKLKSGSSFICIQKEVADYPSMQFTFEKGVAGFLVILSYENQRIHLAEDKVTENRLHLGVNELLNLVPEFDL